MDQLFRLSNELLLEYNYTREFKTLNDSPILVLNNGYNQSNYFFNADSQENVTRNVRDLSALLVDGGKQVSLNIDVSTPYNDLDEKITSTSNFITNFTNAGLNYDTVRVHIISGYNFESSQGFILQFKFKDAFGKEHFLATQLFDKSFSQFEINPNPVIAEERVYNRFIELKIPSLKYIIESFAKNNADPFELANVLTDNKGVTFQQNLTVNYLNLNKLEIKGDYRFYNFLPENSLTVPLDTSFGDLAASIDESTNGDFYELSAKYNGENIENLILELNSGTDADWIILHGIDIIEQIVDTGFVLTQSYNLSQVDNFEQPIFFRPIILNSEWAISWSIDYTVSLFNNVTGERISKNSKKTYMDPKKWGRSLKKINLGTSPIIDEVYNKIENPIYQVNVTESRALNTVKTILTFVESNNILVETKTEFGDDFDGNTRWGQRELNLPISISDNYYNFKISRRGEGNTFNSINLSSTGVVVLRVVLSGTEFIDLVSESDSSLSSGEVTFKINQLTASRINNASKSQFFIILKNEDDESIIYEGKFLNSLDETENQITNLNINLKKEISNLESQIAELDATLTNRETTIKTNEDKIIYLKDINNLYLKKIELLENSLDVTQINSVINNKLRNSVEITEKTDISKGNFSGNTKPDKVSSLNSSLGTYKNI